MVPLESVYNVDYLLFVYGPLRSGLGKKLLIFSSVQSRDNVGCYATRDPLTSRSQIFLFGRLQPSFILIITGPLTNR